MNKTLRQYRWFFSLLLCLTFLVPPAHAERVNLLITVGASPVRITTQSTKVDRLMITSRHGNGGIVYVMLGIPTTTACSVTATTPFQISAELGPGTSTQPGQTLSDPQGANGNEVAEFEDMALACIAGTSPGDLVYVTFWHRT